MCGIAGIHRLTDKPIPKMGRLAMELTLSIADRGRDSTGYLAMLDNGKVQTEKATVPARQFVTKCRAFSEEARTVLLHTRFATVGTVQPVNAHPVISGRCAAIHNGTIYNATELFKTFQLKRRGQVDSEIIPALIDHAGWDEAGAAIELMRGGAALAVVNADRPREVLLARTRSYPLVWMATADYIVWASTEKAIVTAWHWTYKTTPPKDAEWGTLDEWSMMRVNGKVEHIKLDAPEEELHKWSWQRPAARTTPPKQKRSKKGEARKARKAQAATKGAGKRSKGRQVPTPTRPLPVPGLLEREPWMEEVVHTLMRVEGMNRNDAEELTYGTTQDDDPEVWQAQLWMDIQDELSSRAARVDW